MELMARQDKIEDYIWARLGQSVARSLTEEEQTEAPSIYDRQITRIDKLLERLDEIKGQRPSSAEYKKTSSLSQIVTREGLDAGTLAYQEQKAYNELWLAESHAKEDFVGCGTDVDCGFKHGLNFVAIAQETKSMTTDPIWQEIEDLGWELQQRAHPDRVKERTHHQEYQELAIKISKPRRGIQKRIMGKRKPVISLEEAKTLAAEEAAREVEKKWGSQEKK